MADDKESTSDGGWHLDKRVPLAVIATIVGQTIFVVVWLSSLGERVNTLERSEISRAAMAPANADRLTRVEVNVENIKAGVDEIKRLIQRSPPN